MLPHPHAAGNQPVICYCGAVREPAKVRDSAATRQRILESAIREFSAHGMAGARVDRVAEAADCNKAMIYRYFGSKDGLFDAVFDAIVVATVDAVPFDVEDLPKYAADLFEQHRRMPEILRIATWDRLERDGAGHRLPTVVSATEAKLEMIRSAQAAGVLTTAHAPEVLLRIVLALSQPPLSALEADQGADTGYIADAVRAALDAPRS